MASNTITHYGDGSKEIRTATPYAMNPTNFVLGRMTYPQVKSTLVQTRSRKARMPYTRNAKTGGRLKKPPTFMKGILAPTPGLYLPSGPAGGGRRRRRKKAVKVKRKGGLLSLGGAKRKSKNRFGGLLSLTSRRA
jgi:hypothetical protein